VERASSSAGPKGGGGPSHYVRTKIGKPDYTCIAHTYELISGGWHWVIFVDDLDNDQGTAFTKEGAMKIIDLLLIQAGWKLLPSRVNCFR